MSALRFLLAVLAAALAGLAAQEAPRVLVLLADGFNRQEHHGTVAPLEAAGYAVDIAGIRAGPVRLDPQGQAEDPGRDALATLALADVTDAGTYAALVIPGGYSPGVLEQHEDALRICRAFMAAERPVAAICHGGRLLLRAGLLGDRVWTGLWTIADERPDAWRSVARGAFVDQAVVVDRNLITARYPEDVLPFATALLTHLAAQGGQALPTRHARMVLAMPEEDGHQRWRVAMALRALGHAVVVVSDRDRAVAAVTEEMHVVARWGSAQTWDLTLPPACADLLLERHDAAALQVVAAAAAAHGDAVASPVVEPADAVIALRLGFDDAVAAIVVAELERRGRRPVVIADRVGWLRGCNGLPIEATASYAAPPPVRPDAWIVAPGGTWPEAVADSRQAEPAPWLAEQAAFDAQRHAWLVHRWQEGATVIAVGHDAFLLGRGEAVFSGLAFSAAPATRWSFARDVGARFAADPVRRSGERLFTAAGRSALPQLWSLLDE